MIFVATGTHHQPFDRLVLAAAEVAADTDERVVVQHGPSRAPVGGAEGLDRLAPDRFEAALASARIVVIHAGTSSFLAARALGRRPIVVPRRPEHGEHVDDHQVRFAATLSPDEAVVVDPEDLAAAVAAHHDPPAAGDPEARSAAFSDRFAALIDAWFSDA